LTYEKSDAYILFSCEYALIVKILQKQELPLVLKHNSPYKIFNSSKSYKITNISQIDEENKSFYI